MCSEYKNLEPLSRVSSVKRGIYNWTPQSWPSVALHVSWSTRPRASRTVSYDVQSRYLLWKLCWQEQVLGCQHESRAPMMSYQLVLGNLGNTLPGSWGPLVHHNISLVPEIQTIGLAITKWVLGRAILSIGMVTQ